MANPIARIRLGDYAVRPNGAVNRGQFADVTSLRNLTAYAAGDLAQIYSLQRVYSFNASSILSDNGVDIIKPSGIVHPAPGRWISTTTEINGYWYFQIPLHGKLSEAYDGALIDVVDPEAYVWSLASNPFPDEPNVLLTPSADTAILKLPIIPNYRPGGALVFLQVKDNLNRRSLENPFSPFLNTDALFHYILATPSEGLRIPAAGVRNWHVEYRETITNIAETLGSIPSGSGVNTRITYADKNLVPSVTSGGVKSATGLAILATPANDSYVRVFVNGQTMVLGDGVFTGDCFFSNDGAVTARTIANIQAGDQLYWNGSIAGFELSGDDLIDFDYMIST